MFSNLGGQGGGGLFGQQPQQQQQQATGGGLFGAPQQGLFGAPAQTSNTGGLGAMMGQTPQPSGGLFGNTANSGGVGMFGNQQQQQPSFGGQQQQQQPVLGGGLFGQPQQQQQQQQQTGQGGISLFGGAGGPSQGLFGQQAQSTPLLGQIGAGVGGFQQPQQQQQQPQQPGLFGGNAFGGFQQPASNPQQGAGFGGLFGQQGQQTPAIPLSNAPTLFGQAQQPLQQTMPFQQQQQFPGSQGQNSLFGGPQQQQQQNQLFGGLQKGTTVQPVWGQQQQQQQPQVQGFGVVVGGGGGIMGQQGGPDDSVNDANMDQTCTRIEDSISSIVWNQSNLRFLAAATWEGKVRVYELVQNVQNPQRSDLSERRIYQIENSQQGSNVPNSILCLDWKPDGSIIFVGTGIDNTIRAIQVASGQNMIIGQHTAAVIGVFWAEPVQALISVSLDQTLRIWNVNTPGQTTYQMNFQYKPLLVDMNYPLLMIGFATEKLTILNLTQLNAIKNPHYFDSSLGLNSRLTAMQIFPLRDGFGIGSVDGRGHMSNIIIKQQGGYNTNNAQAQHYDLKAIMTFKAHKVEDVQGTSKVNYFFPVNCVQFNCRNQKFMMTAGSEGQMVFWDYEAKNKIKTFQYNNLSIVAAKMSPDGKYLAYALGNDFSKGPDSYQMNIQNKIFVHFIPDNELKCAGR